MRATFNPNRVPLRLLCCAVSAALLVGCHAATRGPGFGYVAGEWDARTTEVPTASRAEASELLPLDEPALPETLDAVDGLTEDEAVAVALWNNAALHETLGQLGVSRAQLYAAGLLTDPQFVVFFPVGPKQLEMTLLPAIDAIWLRPIRLQAAKLDLNRVAQQMIQNGLDVARDVRVAHADLVQARERADLAEEAVALRREIAELAEKRLEAGDISELEAMTTRIDAQQAEIDAERFAEDVVIARDRLAAQLGFSVEVAALDAVTASEPTLSSRSVDELVGEALAVRPDLRAAEFAVEAARGQRRVAKFPFTELDFGWDANADGEEGFESGPALRMRIPIFNGNKGNKAIASAQLRQAVDGTKTVHDRIVLDVRNAHSQAVQARRNLEALRGRVLPTLQEAETLARRNYVGGGTSYFLVLQTTGQFLDARAREIQLEGDLRRAIAELDRSVGHRVVDPPEWPEPDELDSPLLPVPIPGDAKATRDVPRRATETYLVRSSGPESPTAESPGTHTPSRVEPVAAAMPSGDREVTTSDGGDPQTPPVRRAVWRPSWLPGNLFGRPTKKSAANAEPLANAPAATVVFEDVPRPNDPQSREPIGPRARGGAGVVHYPLRPDRR